MKKTAAAVLVAAMLTLSGCTNYYKVTDPSTGKVYYTTELSHKGSGAAELKDGRTGNKISIQNSEVEKINKEQYEAGKAAEPAPAAPAAPAK